jgi:hypothetical protein
MSILAKKTVRCILVTCPHILLLMHEVCTKILRTISHVHTWYWKWNRLLLGIPLTVTEDRQTDKAGQDKIDISRSGLKCVYRYMRFYLRYAIHNHWNSLFCFWGTFSWPLLLDRYCALISYLYAGHWATKGQLLNIEHETNQSNRSGESSFTHTDGIPKTNFFRIQGGRKDVFS